MTTGKWIPVYDEEARAHLVTISPTMRAISRAAQVEETRGPNAGDVVSTALMPTSTSHEHHPHRLLPTRSTEAAI